MKGQKNQAINIYNILRKIGINPKTKGFKILVQAIMIALSCSDDFINLTKIYKQLSVKYNLNFESIRTMISYSLHHLIGVDYKENFEEIFGVKYSEDFYTNQIIIEEVIRIIKR